MFERPHHRSIEKALRTFNAPLLQELGLFFGGGTAIALALGEYRESVDIDFLCSSPDGFKALRGMLSDSINPLLNTPLKHIRDIRTDAYKVLTVIEIDDAKIKIELVREARIALEGQIDQILGIPTLSKVDLYAEKLLANADRGLDKYTLSRDIIDLAMMIHHWGPIPQLAWEKAAKAYGEGLIDKSFQRAAGLIADNEYLANCMHLMQMDKSLLPIIQNTATLEAACLPRTPEADAERMRRIKEVPNLQRKAGTAYTLWQVSQRYLETSTPEQCNWAEVEKTTIVESIGKYRQPVEDVVSALIEHSPAMVSKERQKVVATQIDHMAERQQHMDAASAIDDANWSRSP